MLQWLLIAPKIARKQLQTPLISIKHSDPTPRILCSSSTFYFDNFFGFYVFVILSKYSNVRHSMLLIVWEAKRPINLLHFSMNRKFHKIISQQRIGHIQIYRNALLNSYLLFQYSGSLKYGRIVYREMSQSEPISSCQCRPIDLKAESLLPTNKKPLDQPGLILNRVLAELNFIQD